MRDWKRGQPREKSERTYHIAARIRVAYLQEKKTLKEIGRELGLSYEGLRWYLKAYEIPTRNNTDRGNAEKQAEVAARIREEHVGGKKSLRQIARDLGMSYASLQWYLRQYNIPRLPRTESMRRATDGHGFGWKGGRCLATSGGRKHRYIMLKKPDHPNANKAGYVFEHRYVMAEFLGRALSPDEIVHHVNGNTQDNRLENLEVRFRGNSEEQHHGPLTGCPHCGFDLLQHRTGKPPKRNNP